MLLLEALSTQNIRLLYYMQNMIMHEIQFPVINPTLPPPIKYRASLEDVQLYESNFLACKGNLEGLP